jgi:hypothetical protein
MSSFLFLLILIFVTINIVQTWLILTYKLLIKGGMIIGLMEAVEFSLMIYLFLKGELMIFFTLVFVEIIQWLSIAYLATKG